MDRHNQIHQSQFSDWTTTKKNSESTQTEWSAVRWNLGKFLRFWRTTNLFQILILILREKKNYRIDNLLEILDNRYYLGLIEFKIQISRIKHQGYSDYIKRTLNLQFQLIYSNKRKYLYVQEDKIWIWYKVYSSSENFFLSTLPWRIKSSLSFSVFY